MTAPPEDSSDAVYEVEEGLREGELIVAQDLSMLTDGLPVRRGASSPVSKAAPPASAARADASRPRRTADRSPSRPHRLASVDAEVTP